MSVAEAARLLRAGGLDGWREEQAKAVLAVMDRNPGLHVIVGDEAAVVAARKQLEARLRPGRAVYVEFGPGPGKALMRFPGANRTHGWRPIVLPAGSIGHITLPLSPDRRCRWTCRRPIRA